MGDCLFCKIVEKKIPAQIEYEDDSCVVFHDINPRSKTHLLIIPKKHIPTIKDSVDGDETTFGRMLIVARKMGEQFNLDDYKLMIRVGEKGGQEVFHVHMHLMSMPD
jgi:histidine triad (HIT) family protein